MLRRLGGAAAWAWRVRRARAAPPTSPSTSPANTGRYRLHRFANSPQHPFINQEHCCRNEFFGAVNGIVAERTAVRSYALTAADESRVAFPVAVVTESKTVGAACTSRRRRPAISAYWDSVRDAAFRPAVVSTSVNRTGWRRDRRGNRFSAAAALARVSCACVQLWWYRRQRADGTDGPTVACFVASEKRCVPASLAMTTTLAGCLPSRRS